MSTYETISADELSALLASEEPVFLVDVRSAAETAQGVIERAHLLPLHLVPMNVDKFKGHGRVVIYCHSGARSGQACHLLAQQGIEGLFNLEGGILFWHMGGHPIAPASKATPLV